MSTITFETRNNAEIDIFGEERIYCKHYLGAEKLRMECEAEDAGMEVDTYRDGKQTTKPATRDTCSKAKRAFQCANTGKPGTGKILVDIPGSILPRKEPKRDV